MIVFISASMTFVDKIMEVKKALEAKGHSVRIPLETEKLSERPEHIAAHKNDIEQAKASDIFRKNLQEIASADAILTLNLDKNGIQGYVGPSVLIEMGVGYYLGKHLFLWQDIPHHSQAGWAYEVQLMEPDILNGDITKIV